MAFSYNNNNSGTLASAPVNTGVAAQTGNGLPEILTEVWYETEED